MQYLTKKMDKLFDMSVTGEAVEEVVNSLIEPRNSSDIAEQSERQEAESFYGLPDELAKAIGGNKYFEQYVDVISDDNVKTNMEAFVDKFNNKLSKEEQAKLIAEVKAIDGNNSKRLAKVLEIGANYYSNSTYGAIKKAGSPETLVEGLVERINKLSKDNEELVAKQKLLLGDKQETPLEMEQKREINVLRTELSKMQNPYNQMIYAQNKQRELSDTDLDFIKGLHTNNPLDSAWDEKVMVEL